MMYALRSYFDFADVGLEPGTYQLYIADQSQFVTQAFNFIIPQYKMKLWKIMFSRRVHQQLGVYRCLGVERLFLEIF